MNIKYLMMTSVIALISTSVAQAADIVAPHEVTSHRGTSIVSPSAFSWTGFYLGGQVGNFSSKVEITDSGKKDEFFGKDKTPKPSGFMGGIYAGSNIDLGNSLILGVETGAVWADKGDTKTLSTKELEDGDIGDFNMAFTDAGIKLGDAEKFVKGDTGSYSFTYKEKWAGATRARIGFAAANCIMPYIAGGIAYAQMQGISTISGTKKSVDNKPSKTVTGTVGDKTKMMVGFTLGGGVDFAMTDNILLRAEYRYSDFGKKKFKDDEAEFNYKTNDFRVGVAYKF
ncbi:outer membrane protein [Bartonella vinsonii]|uniref:Opacity protein and related surface antigens n=1 Tax=Bartonella vinsonii TaxID=33047 RepID=A0A448V502_BARVI|nr:outer membrane protein [Bartonella vinsonii]VEJ44853.1 Opacity protein and related surface antigens [Bartonella vinsonii]